MTEFHPLPQHEAVRDGRGKYALPHPVTNHPGKFTSVTTFIKSGEPPAEHLERWKKRKLVKGLGRRSDLYALAASIPDTDSRRLDELIRDAEQAGGISEAANYGTAMHDFTEAADRGLEPFVPDEFRYDVDAYLRTLGDLGIRIIDEYIESVVYVPGYDLVGRIDRIVEHEGQLKIADLKTGKDPEKKFHAFALQFACYANASHVWDEAWGVWGDMPGVSKTEALAISLPVGSGQCDVYRIDIETGWKAVAMCEQNRRWRAYKGLGKKL